MNRDTDGWIPMSSLPVNGQCCQCAMLLEEAKMCCCPYGRHEFPDAHKCTAFLPIECED